jgi:(p)ppGpp synthase/HD superfamily hydrolase
MIYTDLTKRAMQMAYDAHHGQTDKSGVPYIFHPIQYMDDRDGDGMVGE